MRQWRVIIEPDFQNGPNNMAIDGAVLESVANGLQLPTLRLYGWRPMCLSLGYGQRTRDADLGRLQAHGWHLLRRPTGGKAILHGDELTYSLSLPLTHPLAAANVIESYRRISRGLLQTLRNLGLSAVSEHQVHQGQIQGPVCFDISSPYEITVNQRKIIGSAQLRRRGGLLQHGTIPLSGDIARICDALTFDSPQARQLHKRKLRRHAATLADVMGHPPSWTETAAALERGFCQAFQLEMTRGRLSDHEEQRRAALLAERFDNPAWTNKR